MKIFVTEMKIPLKKIYTIVCACVFYHIYIYIYSIEKKRKSDSHKFGLVGGPISTK